MSAGRWPRQVEHLPVCPHRDLPIPYIAEIAGENCDVPQHPRTPHAHFTILDPGRARECLQGRLCAMCGRPMSAEVALLGDVVSLRPDGFFIEPPVCEPCADLALGGLCPFLSRERVPRRPPEDGVTVVGGGRDELPDVGRIIAKRPVVMAITCTYTPAWIPNDTRGLTLVYQAGPIERVRRFAWVDGRAAEVLPEPTRPVRVVRNQPRRKKPRSRR